MKYLSFFGIVFLLSIHFQVTGSESFEDLTLNEQMQMVESQIYSDPTQIDSLTKLYMSNALAEGDSVHFINGVMFLGIDNAIKANYGQALKKFQDAYEFALNKDNVEVQVNALNNMAGVYQYSGQYEKAESRLIKAVQLSKTGEGTLLEGNLLLALGMVQDQLEKYDESLKNLKLAMKIFDSKEEKNLALSCMSELGFVLEKQEKYEQALDVYERMVPIYEFTDDKRGMIVLNQRIGSASMKVGDMKEAVAALETALTLSDELNFESGKDSTLIWLVQSSAAIGNIDKVSEYSGRLTDYTTMQNAKNNAEVLANAEVRYDLRELEHVNVDLKDQLDEQHADIKTLIFVLKIAGVAIVLLLALSFGIWLRAGRPDFASIFHRL